MLQQNIKANETIQPNSKALETLKADFPQFFDKDGNFLRDRFDKMLKANNVALSKEGYELAFLGKSYARYVSATKTETFLAPHTAENAKPLNAKSENLYIIGDNLDALKHLLGSYAGKIKCIYIDPPYNTGSDGFVYPDNFSFSAAELSRMIGIEEEEAARIINLKGKSSHSAWLSFMYPRLILARELLSDDGVIFISIDDNEQANLKLMCDEIFGEENFIAEFVWKSKLGKVGTTSTISSVHEYIICFSKQALNVQFKMIKNISAGRKENLRQWGVADRREDRPSMYYPITINGVKVYPIKEDGSDGRWRVGKEMAKQLLKEGLLELREKNGQYNIYRNFSTGESFTAYTSLLLDEIGTTAKGATMLKNLSMSNVFDFSKPIELLQHFFDICTVDNDIILDFFSGSATTAHAVMQLNAEDGGKRKYIMVQLPEKIANDKPAYKAGYKTIDEIGRERIKRAAKKIQAETGADIDCGFKTYSLETPTGKMLDALDAFNPDDAKLLPDDMVGIFDTEYATGKAAILASYLVLDGYGLTSQCEQYTLDTFTAEKIEKSLYLIEPGISSADVMELIRKIESLELDISRVVVYAYSLDFSVLHELRKNLAALRNNKHVELIERY